MLQSGFRTTLTRPLSPTDTTAYVKDAPAVTEGRFYIWVYEYEKNGVTSGQHEWISYSGVTTNGELITLTNVKRNLSTYLIPAIPTGGGANGTGFQWSIGQELAMVKMHDQEVANIELVDTYPQFKAVIYDPTLEKYQFYSSVLTALDAPYLGFNIVYSLPGSAVRGEGFYNVTTQKAYVYDGTVFAEIGTTISNGVWAPAGTAPENSIYIDNSTNQSYWYKAGWRPLFNQINYTVGDPNISLGTGSRGQIAINQSNGTPFFWQGITWAPIRMPIPWGYLRQPGTLSHAGGSADVQVTGMTTTNTNTPIPGVTAASMLWYSDSLTVPLTGVYALTAMCKTYTQDANLTLTNPVNYLDFKIKNGASLVGFDHAEALKYSITGETESIPHYKALGISAGAIPLSAGDQITISLQATRACTIQEAYVSMTLIDYTLIS